MILNHEINYIVSGIERSGTSMLMQILNCGDIPIKFDDSRKEDENNPKGYYELEGGKIINKLMDGTFPVEEFKGSFIKITAYGLKYLPPGNYKIIYSERNIEEILDSMEKMADIKDENRLETKETFLKLNSMIKELIDQRTDCNIVYVNYNEILENPEEQIKKITKFLEINDEYVDSMIEAIDTKLYRQRRKNIA